MEYYLSGNVIWQTLARKGVASERLFLAVLVATRSNSVSFKTKCLSLKKLSSYYEETATPLQLNLTSKHSQMPPPPGERSPAKRTLFIMKNNNKH